MRFHLCAYELKLGAGFSVSPSGLFHTIRIVRFRSHGNQPLQSLAREEAPPTEMRAPGRPNAPGTPCWSESGARRARRRSAVPAGFANPALARRLPPPWRRATPQGFQVSRKTIKFFSPFERSDVLICSPLGLREITGAEGDKQREFDFLSSIEVAGGKTEGVGVGVGRGAWRVALGFEMLLRPTPFTPTPFYMNSRGRWHAVGGLIETCRLEKAVQFTL